MSNDTASKTKAPRQQDLPKSGESLIPDFDKFRKGVEKRMWFWAGAYPSCPAVSLDCGDASFPMVTETVYEREGTEASQRVPHIGNLLHLNRKQVDGIKEQLSRSVIRFYESKPAKYAGQGLDASIMKKQCRKGKPIRIWTDEQIDQREAKGYFAPRYHREDFDEPMADHIFMVPFANQDNPSADQIPNIYPPPLSETGLEWPED